MKEHIVVKYRHTLLFYLLATLIPWIFWFAASYVSHHVVYSESTWVAPLLGLVGLFFPMFLTIILVFQRQELRKDFLGRFLNLSSDKWQYYLTACLLSLQVSCVPWQYLYFSVTVHHNSLLQVITPSLRVSFLYGSSLFLHLYLRSLRGMVMEQTASVLE